MAATKKPAKTSSPAQSAPEKDPKGGLTSAGRKAYAKKEGAHLKPGVTGPADTPEKMKRKGSFLRRHFATPRGPMVKNGEPTRLALSAHAWGEPVPKTMAAAKKLADKGTKLLERYADTREKNSSAKKAVAKKTPAKKASATKAPSKKKTGQSGAQP